MKKKLLFTFDYELFLGERSGSVQKCMIEPTQQLIDIFDSHNFKHAIFFVDTTYLIRLKEEAKTSPAAKQDFEKIQAQLIQLVQKEHYVFPHIHPHWLDAYFDAGTNSWKLADISKYRFHSISEKQRTALFDQSMHILTEILLPAKPDYKIDGFRAGGWCIQPFEDFKAHFSKHGIHTDFSVLPGIKNLSTAQYYDFEKAPDAAIYNFENDVVKAESKGSFQEIAISVIEIPPTYQLANKFWLKYLWKTGNRSIGDGGGVVAKSTEAVEQKKSNREMVSLELLNLVKFPFYKQFLNHNELVHFISHPKMLSRHNLKYLQKYLKHAVSRYQIESDFRHL